MKQTFSIYINSILILALITPWQTVNGFLYQRSLSTNNPESSDFYKTKVKINERADLERLQQLGVTILDDWFGSANIQVNGDQLEELARLGYQPQETMLLADGIAAQSPAIDSDADGLTDTQEAWWCTNPVNTDTDQDGKTDGQEIQAVKDWVGNRRSTPPGETPWSSWPFNDTTCPDKDKDSIPNLAERYELGTNMDWESTDRDRFDDGQEVFGVTYCPGSASACGYGILPSANHDGILLFPQMPAWVTAPGNHPLVAAFPKLEVDLIPDAQGFTFHMQAATTITTDQRTEEGETKSYSTTKTEGTSTSNTDTETWETWEEVSNTEQSPSFAQTQNPSFLTAASGGIIIDNSSTQIVQSTNVSTTSIFQQVANITNNITKAANPIGQFVTDKVTSAANFVLDEACAEIQCKKYAGSAVRATVRTAIQSFDAARQQIGSNQCAKDLWNKVKCATNAVGTTFQNNWKTNFDERLEAATLEEQQARGQVSGSVVTSDGSTMGFQSVFPVSYPISTFVPTTTTTSGSSRGGSHSTTHTQYEEHSVTEGTAKQFGKSWGTATAQNSAHAADLWFSYQISNVGTDYARQICNLSFNLYIGDNPAPVATYFPGADLGGQGCFLNFRPGEAHKYAFPSSSRIALTLEQVKEVDLGAPVRIVVEDFSLGQDDYYTDDAVNGGVAISIEDGVEDGDEKVDTYLIPTWGEETVLDVLARYFPYERDANGLVVAAWTPEQRQDVPAWCVEPRMVGSVLWCKHSLSTSEWWNIYTQGLTADTEGFQNTPAAPDTVVLFRFAQDSDADGYNDRTEVQLETDPKNPQSRPYPDLAAGLSQEEVGNQVTATLSLLNSGLYDAFGVEAVMIAPDDSITITNNTVGGAGRVRAGKQVIVGSQINQPAHGAPAWTGTAKAISGGYFTGTTSETYSFTVVCTIISGCVVGQNAFALIWSGGGLTNQTINVASSYGSPTLLSVGDKGVKVGFISGTVKNGETFTVQTLPPSDVFQYTINRRPYTQPVVIVSYNDLLGNHRFILPDSAMDRTDPSTSLISFSGLMIKMPEMKIQTQRSVLAGDNELSILINNSSPNLFKNHNIQAAFLDSEGNVVLDIGTVQDVPAGPSVVNIPWNTAAFTQAYDPNQEYLALTFWTDYDGNILATVGRPLSSFQQDPQASLAVPTSDAEWNFGESAQNSLLQKTLTFANQGQQELLTYVIAPQGLSVSQTGSQRISPADLARYTVTLNTAGLPVGAYDQTITIRTSDLDHPQRTVRVTGTITAAPEDITQGAVERPLDFAATISGIHNQGEWVEFTHDLGPEPQSLHPIRVFNFDLSQLLGVGKYASSFGQSGTSSYELFGNSKDGDLLINSGQVYYTDSVRTNLLSITKSQQNSIAIPSNPGFTIGDEVLIYQSQGVNAGHYEYGRVENVSESSLVLDRPLQQSYGNMGLQSSTCNDGVLGQYFSNKTLSGSPVFSRCDRSVWFDWSDWGPGNGVPNDNFSVRWSGEFYVPYSGPYPITVTVDDGIRIYVDGVLLINEWHSAGSLTYNASPNLSTGFHTMTVEYYEEGGGSVVLLSTNGAVSSAQVIRVPNFKNVTVASGGTITAHPWDGRTGGVLAFRVSNSINNFGVIQANGIGYQGGEGGPNLYDRFGRTGESYEGIGGVRTTRNNFGGGGGGQGDTGNHPSGPIGVGGGGAGYGSSGTKPPQSSGGPSTGLGGVVYGDSFPGRIYLGSGGGGGGSDSDPALSPYGGRGGNGGGAVILSAYNFATTGIISSNGINGSRGSVCSGGGGGGSGGSIVLYVGKGNIGSSLVQAIGASGGPDGNGGSGEGVGGNGGVGKVHLNYCESISGSSTPLATTKKMACFITEQVEVDPYTTTRFSLPESFTSEHTYNIQYGRRLVFSGVSEQVTTLRIPAWMLSFAKMDALISGVGSGTLNFKLDIGNNGSWDWSHADPVTDSVSLTSPDLSAAFNAYWNANGRPTSSTLDVPVRVWMDKPGQVLLTNLQVRSSPSTLRYLRLPAGDYSKVQLQYTLSGINSTGAIGIDVGDDGTVEDAWSGIIPNSINLTSDKLSSAVNAYLTGKTGEVDVLIRFIYAPALAVKVTSLSSTLTGTADTTLSVADIHLPTGMVVEGDTISVSATVRNNGAVPSQPIMASFFAASSDWGDWYLGSALVPMLSPNGPADVSIQWDTEGFHGAVPVKVILDPTDRLAETSETNNTATASLNILTRPDLQVDPITFSDDEPVVGQAVTVSLNTRNAGQTAASSAVLRLYEGDAGTGTSIGEDDFVIPAARDHASAFTWTPSKPGWYRLTAISDAGQAVNEGDESNNNAWRDVYVGFAGSIQIDSGAADKDLVYSSAAGFGVIEDTVTPDQTGSCGTDVKDTYRRGPDGLVEYRFDHLLPGHFYHLDLTLYNCPGEPQRLENILVDGVRVAGPVDLGDNQVHRLSIRLDPALYADRQIIASIEAPGNIFGAIVNEINLYDVDYRYADSGGANDPSYPGTQAFGYLDGNSSTVWGTLPAHSVRLDSVDNKISYRFDAVSPTNRYNVHLTFFQGNTAAQVALKVQLDGYDTGSTFYLNPNEKRPVTIAVPPAYYQEDSSFEISVIRLDSKGPFVNEIALEEETLPVTGCGSVQATPYSTIAYGNVLINSAPAVVGTKIEALNTNGDLVGCFVTTKEGLYGYMPIYGEDVGSSPVIPGMKASEVIRFRVNGAPAFASTALYWQDDHAQHQVDLNMVPLSSQTITLKPGWNLIGFNLDLPWPSLPIVLQPIQGRFDRVLSETGFYSPAMQSQFNTLNELYPGKGYFIRVTGTTTITLMVEGRTLPPNSPISLHTGWNWISGPSAAMAPAQALASIQGKHQLVRSLDKVYDPARPEFSTMTEMRPSEGYQIYMSQAADLLYPQTGANAAASLEKTESSSIHPACSEVQRTPASMMVFGTIDAGEQQIPSGTTIKVYTPRGELAGCALIDQEGRLPYMQVYGAYESEPGFEVGEPLSFHINGHSVDMGSTLFWCSDFQVEEAVLLLQPLDIPNHIYLPAIFGN